MIVKKRPAVVGVPAKYGRVAVVVVVVVGALAVRSALINYQSGDFGQFQNWYDYIAQHGRFAALKDNFANYNEPYLYLLALLSYTSLSPLIGIKAISIAFDLLLSYFTFRIVRLRYPTGWLPLAAGTVVLFLPTVVLNSAMWGQVDSIYASLGIGGVYFLLRRRPWLACVFFGLAFAFKLQIIFLFPLLLLLAVRRYLPWRPLLAIPAVFVALDIPALLAGAKVSDLLSIYTSQVGQYQQLTLNAPNVYQFFGVTESTTIRYLGIAVTGFVVLALIALAAWRRIELTATRIVLAATLSALLLPYLLPAMHERYFYLADVLTVIAAFSLPQRLMALPALEQFASVFSYLPFLLSTGHLGGQGSRRAPSTGATPGGPSGGTFRGGAPGSGGGVVVGPGAPHGGGGIGHSVIDFRILAVIMLAAVVLALWVSVDEFRKNTVSSSPSARPVSSST
ncbi:MAG: DUF2029 domain-containing protein [Sciscionella sp.]|nr:DUF2029 domain-containing protein [Sciscionella sp.]